MKLRSICAAAALCLASGAMAVPVNKGDGTALDASTQLLWLSDANRPGTTNHIDASGLLTFAEAVEWANELVFAGFDDWRLPGFSERIALDGGTFSNVQDYYWLTGTVPGVLPGYGLVFSPDANLWQSPLDEFNYAIAVRDVPVGPSPIPEPGTWALMLAGLGVISAAVRRRTSKR